MRDVTREVRLEQMRKDFVANASHELRSPLTVVAGYLENFSADPALGELPAPVAEMRRQTDRMTRIIEDLLELSRFEANDAPIKGAAHRRVGDGVDASQGRAGARPRIRARSKSPSSRAPSCIGDEAMVQSAFSNLVDNAAKYTPPEGSMQIRWWTDEDGRAFLRARHRPRHSSRAHSAAH